VELYPNHSSEIAHFPYRGEIAAKMPRISPWVMTTQIGNLLRMNPVNRDRSVDIAGGKLGVPRRSPTAISTWVRGGIYGRQAIRTESAFCRAGQSARNWQSAHRSRSARNP
jgi:hypothetical protein